MVTKPAIVGGEFLLKEITPDQIFIPEEFDEEQRLIAESCIDFVETEVDPYFDALDNHQAGLMPSLLKKAGVMGLLGISIPEEFEGFGQSFVTNMKANEAMGSAYSFSVAFMAHTGIGTLPLLYYGNSMQHHKYMPRLATGEMLAAYCLTEPGAGSDANAGKTKAVLSDDGSHYILNGQKMWITNGGFADLLTVFAKIDNDRVLSAFLVEANTPGITMNPEEHKMGIKGSSTRQIFFNDVKVPVENLLGKRGEGFRIALNILHIGRIKLGATVLGGMRRAINNSVTYSGERKQFGSPLSDFGAIKFKLAEQVILLFSTESAVYRASKDIQDTIENNLEEGKSYGEANIEGVAEYEPECALLKVYGSESLDYIVDEMVQIFGGMGFSSEAPADRSYRDSRINRIFEGTNEINRLITVDSVMKKGLKHRIALFEKAREILAHIDLLEAVDFSGDYYRIKKDQIANLKKVVLILLPLAQDIFQRKLMFEEEILMNISDAIMNIYVVESTELRVEKLQMMDKKQIELYKDMLDVLTHSTVQKVHQAAFDAIGSIVEGEQLIPLVNALNKLTYAPAFNVKESRRRIANQLIDDGMYKF
ncbi:MAG: acyl-CoA dehydrogenase [Bacteroidetes bacterium CG18_big_fil_WC_8_21_14_2_50_41_14]|nr:MAG: acyl-CoA dehydrogenase [Bacteroidetes bacterium CG18_big_fil_WC_8_21_14_2_50_41_14]PJB54780.1 MAG: acyl-CoA dehydrogenase [Bacteroidetes bacterium CG_4_9_14_3_um_filter_41_19]